MNEQARHIIVIGMGAVIAIIAIFAHTCEKELFALVGMLWAGEFGLSRTQPPPPAVRVDHPVTINQQERREP